MPIKVLYRLLAAIFVLLTMEKCNYGADFNKINNLVPLSKILMDTFFRSALHQTSLALQVHTTNDAGNDALLITLISCDA